MALETWSRSSCFTTDRLLSALFFILFFKPSQCLPSWVVSSEQFQKATDPFLSSSERQSNNLQPLGVSAEVDGVATESSVCLAPGFCWSSWVLARADSPFSPSFHIILCRQNINLSVYIFRFSDSYGHVITPQLLLWHRQSGRSCFWSHADLNSATLKSSALSWRNIAPHDEKPAQFQQAVWQLPAVVVNSS